MNHTQAREKATVGRGLATCPRCASSLIYAYHDRGTTDEWRCVNCGWRGAAWPKATAWPKTSDRTCGTCRYRVLSDTDQPCIACEWEEDIAGEMPSRSYWMAR